jgi:hypothetical protein
MIRFVRMNAKLTLSLDRQVVEDAKVLAKEKHTSLSRMFEDYLRVLLSSKETPDAAKTSSVDSLVGLVQEEDASKAYRQVRYEDLKQRYGL